MKTHWTERSIKDYRFRIVADFISQLEEKMENEEINREKLANSLSRTKSRISQLLNNPGNITFNNVVKLAKALNMKVSLVAYEDDDPENKRGPINSEIFKICWEKAGKPQDFWAIQQAQYDQKFDWATTDINTAGESPSLYIIKETAGLTNPEIKDFDSAYR